MQKAHSAQSDPVQGRKSLTVCPRYDLFVFKPSFRNILCWYEIFWCFFSYRHVASPEGRLAVMSPQFPLFLSMMLHSARLSCHTSCYLPIYFSVYLPFSSSLPFSRGKILISMQLRHIGDMVLGPYFHDCW